jgi:hypothetical protein
LLAAIHKIEGDNKDMEEYNTRVDMEEDNIDMEEVLTYRKRQYRCVKRPETTDTENSSDSSESIPSLASAIVQRANINERVARELVTSPKLEVDDIDMKEDNINMEEVLTYRKIPYRCLKRPEITDTENSCDSSESIQSLASAIVQRANINKRATRLLSAIPKLEDDSIELEENNVEMEEGLIAELVVPTLKNHFSARYLLSLVCLHIDMVVFCMYEYCLLPFLHCFLPALCYHLLIWE